MSLLKLTPEEVQQFIDQFSVCDEGIRASIALGSLGMEPDEAIKVLKLAGMREYVAWLRMIKQTEAYVRWNGKEITMGSYQVFNPLTGQHIDCETEEDVKATMANIAQQLLDAQTITVCQSLSNEKGDSVWIPYRLETPYMVVQKT